MEKPAANFIINGKKQQQQQQTLMLSLLKLETRQRCLFLPLLFDIVLVVLAKVIIRHRKNKINAPRWKRKVLKIAFICKWYNMYAENPKESTLKITRMNEFRKGQKIQDQRTKLNAISMY